jgi:hypothetical protein
MQDTRRPRPPWGLLGALALAWAIEGFVARSDWTGPLGWSWRSAREAVAGVRGCRVLLFGDSQVKVGIAADRLGVPAYNLAVLRAQPAASATLLRRALEAGARPEAVVLDAFPGLLTDGPRLNGAEWAELLDARGWLDLLREAPDPMLAARALAHALVPSVEARWSIRPALRAALAGTPAPARLAVERADRLAHRGSVVVRAEGAPLAEALPALPAGAAGRKNADWWKARPEHRAALRRFCALAQAHGIRVYWLWPTHAPATQARREALGLDEPLAAMVRGLQAEFPNLHVLDVRRAGLDGADFYDPNHLNDRGAAALTDAVAAVIGADLHAAPPPGRWLALRVRPGAAVAAAPGASRRD